VVPQKPNKLPAVNLLHDLKQFSKKNSSNLFERLILEHKTGGMISTTY
jgi:hypothetical protein